MSRYILWKNKTGRKEVMFCRYDDNKWFFDDLLDKRVMLYKTDYLDDTILKNLLDYYQITKIHWKSVHDPDSYKVFWFIVDYNPDNPEEMEMESEKQFEVWQELMRLQYPEIMEKIEKEIKNRTLVKP